MDINSLQRIYFIGIGGIGMSALARFFNREGIAISGYDKTETTLTKKLVEEGMDIHYEDRPDLIPEKIDLVVYTPAVPKDHKELSQLMESNIPVLKRSQVLGLISEAKKCIAVAGTHGKTTTSSMTAHLLKDCGMDISCFLGGIANNFGSNYCYGESEWTVIEADEFDRSFHTLRPEIAILLSMDPDHLDIYGAKEKMQESFEIFLLKVNEGGQVLVHYDLMERFSESFLNQLHAKHIAIHTFGVNKGAVNVSELKYTDGFQTFDYFGFHSEIKNFQLSMPGIHNTSNMCAAIAVAELLGNSEEKIKAAVKSFSGIKRRFDINIERPDFVYVDDYAHHPGELNAAISSAKALWPDKKLTVVFQPHLFSRTNDFMEEFAEELSKVDELILMEIYPARELPMDGVTSSVLLEKVNLGNKSLVQKSDLVTFIKGRKPELLMTLGAGDIDVFVELIKKAFE